MVLVNEAFRDLNKKKFNDKERSDIFIFVLTKLLTENDITSILMKFHKFGIVTCYLLTNTYNDWNSF